MKQKSKIRPLAKLAPAEQMQGAYGTQNRSVSNIHEDSSTGVTKQMPAGVEFSKRSKAAPIAITDNAAERIKVLLKNRGKESLGVRVGVKQGGCSGLSYFVEYADSQDKYEEVVEDKGVRVFIEPKAIIYLLGTTMDYVDETVKSGFVFVNPNEKGKCGCGESFRV